LGKIAAYAVRDTALVLKINKNTVIRTLKKSVQVNPRFQALKTAENLEVTLELACEQAEMNDVTQQNEAGRRIAGRTSTRDLIRTVAQFKVDGYSRHTSGGPPQAMSSYSLHAVPPAKKTSTVKPKPIKLSSFDDWEEF
jgi:hypothetical protein